MPAALNTSLSQHSLPATNVQSSKAHFSCVGNFRPELDSHQGGKLYSRHLPAAPLGGDRWEEEDASGQHALKAASLLQDVSGPRLC